MASFQSRVSFLAIYSYVLVLTLFVVVRCSITRKLHFIPQLDCDISECEEGYNNSFPNLGYIRADGPNDTIHYLTSTIGLPSVLILYTDRHAPNPSINWNKLLSNNVSGSIELNCDKCLHYSFGLIFTKLYEYNDTDFNANLTYYNKYNESHWRIHDFLNFDWFVMEFLGQNSFFKFRAKSEGINETFLNGSISLSVFGRDKIGKDGVLPHLLYNENITQLEITLNDFKPNFVLSRFGLEMAFVGEHSRDNVASSLEISKTLDDEHTPGVFQTFNWLTKSTSTVQNGFLQWKPIVYTKPKRARLNGIKVISYDIENFSNVEDFKEDIISKTIIYGFYQRLFHSDHMFINAMNVSFGLPGDDDFSKTNYSVWTMSLGLGLPPHDTVSSVVITIISVGLGIPVLFMLFGGAFVFFKKYHSKKVAASGRQTNFPELSSHD